LRRKLSVWVISGGGPSFQSCQAASDSWLSEFHQIIARIKQAQGFWKIGGKNFAQRGFRGAAASQPDDFWRAAVALQQFHEIIVLVTTIASTFLAAKKMSGSSAWRKPRSRTAAAWTLKVSDSQRARRDDKCASSQIVLMRPAWMINPAAGEQQAGFQIVRFQIRHFLQNLRRRQARCEQVEHVAYSNAHSANTGAATALAGIYCDSI
jgi:hypothetical protein